MMYHNKVYDFTKFKDEHPGNNEEILLFFEYKYFFIFFL